MRFERPIRAGSDSPGSTGRQAVLRRPSAGGGHHLAASRAALEHQSPLERLCKREHLSTREISRLVGASRSGVLNALERFSIQRNEDRPARTGLLRFGFDYLDHQLVKNGVEYAAIRMIREYRDGGLSLREIAGKLKGV